MSVSPAGLNIGASAIGNAITHFSLINSSGVQLGSRVARTATTTGGVVRPSSDITFEVPGGSTVAGWRAHTAATGGTDVGGSALTAETYAGAGQYVLEAAGTDITINAG